MRVWGRGSDSERVRLLSTAPEQIAAPTLWWPLTGAISAVLAALFGWLVPVAVCLLGWVEVTEVSFAEPMRLGTGLWLLAHGVPLGLAGSTLSIVPGTLTLLVVIGIVVTMQFGLVRTRERRVTAFAAMFAAIYLLIVLVTGSVIGSSGIGLLKACVFVLAVVAAMALREHGWNPPVEWFAAGMRGVGVGLAVLFACGALALVVAIISSADRITLIHDSLGAGGLGSVVLILAQLGWLVTLLVWASAWALGAGISLGVGTAITPAQSLVGMVPAIPLMGAVPSAGAMPTWAMVWLASGVLAGVAAAYQPTRRALNVNAPAWRVVAAGGLAGVVTGLAFTAIQALAVGDLGSTRLVDVGARLGHVAVLAPSILGVSGAVLAGVLLLRASRNTDSAAKSD